MSEAQVPWLLCLALLAFSAAAHPSNRLYVPDPDEKIFNVLDYRAKTGAKDSAMNFVAAWDAACNSSAKARVLIPKGVFTVSQTYFNGPCNTKGPIIVQLDGIVKVHPDNLLFPNGFFFTIRYVDNLIFFGNGGLLDGQDTITVPDKSCNDTIPNSMYHSRMNVWITGCSNVVVRNIHSVKPMGYNFIIDHSNNVKLQGLHLSGPKGGTSKSGIFINNSTSVRISKSVISAANDCISFGEGSKNVLVTRITCTSGSGISVGYLGMYDGELEVKNITVKDVTISDSEYGLWFRAWKTPFATKVYDITFQDITMNNVKYPIFLIKEADFDDTSYMDKHANTSHVQISDVRFVNITGTTMSETGVTLNSRSAAVFENVVLKNRLTGKIVTCVRGVKSLADVSRLVLGTGNCF